MKFSKAVKQIEEEGLWLSRETQRLAVMSLELAKERKCAEAPALLVEACEPLYRPCLIRWLEAHGKITWSNKKKRFVNNPNGRWRIESARRTPWDDDERTIEGASPLGLKVEKYCGEAGVEEQIRRYIRENPAPESIGAFGVPQAKLRNGTYGLRGMVFDSWRRHVLNR